MPPSQPSDLPKAGLFGAGLGVRVGLAAAVIALLWLAAAWAAHAGPAAPAAAGPSATIQRE